MGGEIVKRRFVACSSLVLVLLEECDICATRKGETTKQGTDGHEEHKQALELPYTAKGLVIICMNTTAL